MMVTIVGLHRETLESRKGCRFAQMRATKRPGYQVLSVVARPSLNERPDAFRTLLAEGLAFSQQNIIAYLFVKTNFIGLTPLVKHPACKKNLK